VIGEGGGALVNLSHGMADLASYGNANRDFEQVGSFSLYIWEGCKFAGKVTIFFLKF